MNLSCFLSLAACRTPCNPCNMRFPLCVRRMCDRTMFSLLCALPSPTSVEGCPPLFGWFTGTTAQSDFSRTFTSAVRFMASADRSCSVDQDVQEISRFSCMLFLSLRGFLDYAGPSIPLASSVVAVSPSSLPERSRRPVPSAFRSSIARPTDTPVYASSDTSRSRLQDSGPGSIRCLLSCRALSSPTTCRFIPALSGLPTIWELPEKHGTCRRFTSD